MIAVVKSTEANITTTSQHSRQPTRRTSWTVLLNLAPRRRRRRMSSDQLASPNSLPSPRARRSPSPGSASPSPSTENRRFPGISFPGRGKKKNARKHSKSNLLEPTTIRVDAERLKQWASSFDDILSDPLGLQLFQAFLRSEVSEENILFWKACQSFKSSVLTPDDQLQAQAQKIFAEYISMSPSAPNLVNIDHHTRADIMEHINSPSRNMFDRAEHGVYVLMCQDSFCRFVQSRQYKEGVFKDIPQ